MKVNHNVLAILLTICFYYESTAISYKTFIDDSLDFFWILWSSWCEVSDYVMRNNLSAVDFYFVI